MSAEGCCALSRLFVDNFIACSDASRACKLVALQVHREMVWRRFAVSPVSSREAGGQGDFIWPGPEVLLGRLWFGLHLDGITFLLHEAFLRAGA